MATAATKDQLLKMDDEELDSTFEMVLTGAALMYVVKHWDEFREEVEKDDESPDNSPHVDLVWAQGRVKVAETASLLNVLAKIGPTLRMVLTELHDSDKL